jgi:hypothetical protein
VPEVGVAGARLPGRGLDLGGAADAELGDGRAKAGCRLHASLAQHEYAHAAAVLTVPAAHIAALEELPAVLAEALLDGPARMVAAPGLPDFPGIVKRAMDGVIVDREPGAAARAGYARCVGQTKGQERGA